MQTGILAVLAILSIAGAGAVGTTMAMSHATASGMQGTQGGSGMMNGAYGGGMMGSGSCPYQGNYAYCQQYMEQHSVSNADCPMMS